VLWRNIIKGETMSEKKREFRTVEEIFSTYIPGYESQDSYDGLEDLYDGLGEIHDKRRPVSEILDDFKKELQKKIEDHT